jgi:hypothetical protein
MSLSVESCSISLRRRRRICSISAVEQLPRRIQMTFGVAAAMILRSMKSASLVTINQVILLRVIPDCIIRRAIQSSRLHMYRVLINVRKQVG